MRDEGLDALSRRRVAAELGTSVNTIRRTVAGWADLARLAADHVVARRRAGRLNRRTDDPVERAVNIIRWLMPEDLSHLDEELVWLKLVVGCALRPSGLSILVSYDVSSGSANAGPTTARSWPRRSAR